MAEKNTKGSGMKLVLLHRFGGMLRPCSQGGGTVPGATRVYLAQRGARLGAATFLRAEQRANGNVISADVAFEKLNSGSSNRTRMWANAQRDGRPAEYRWRPLFNAAKFGSRPLLQCRAVTLQRSETR